MALPTYVSDYELEASNPEKVTALHWGLIPPDQLEDFIIPNTKQLELYVNTFDQKYNAAVETPDFSPHCIAHLGRLLLTSYVEQGADIRSILYKRRRNYPSCMALSVIQNGDIYAGEQHVFRPGIKYKKDIIVSPINEANMNLMLRFSNNSDLINNEERKHEGQ